MALSLPAAAITPSFTFWLMLFQTFLGSLRSHFLSHFSLWMYLCIGGKREEKLFFQGDSWARAILLKVPIIGAQLSSHDECTCQETEAAGGEKEGGTKWWDTARLAFSLSPCPPPPPIHTHVRFLSASRFSFSFNVGHLCSPELGPSAATISLASTARLISPALRRACECCGSPAGLLLIRCTFWFVLSLIAFSVTYNGWPPRDLHIAWLTDLFIYRPLPASPAWFPPTTLPPFQTSTSLLCIQRPPPPNHHLVPLKSQPNRSREGSSTIKYTCHPPSLQDKSLSVLLSNSRQLD